MREVRIDGDWINGLFHLLINGIYLGYNPLILTVDPNFQRDIQVVASLSMTFLGSTKSQALSGKNHFPLHCILEKITNQMFAYMDPYP